jgi:hypothetical protein
MTKKGEETYVFITEFCILVMVTNSLSFHPPSPGPAPASLALTLKGFLWYWLSSILNPTLLGMFY